MRTLLVLLRHEIHMLWISPATYIAALLFTFLMGAIYLFILDDFSQAPHFELPSTLFFKTFWVPLFFMVPLLTMRSLAEERRLGTLETLMTTPVSARQIVWSKFLGAYCLYEALWLISLTFPLITRLTLPFKSIDPCLLDKPSYMGGYCFIALSGFLYVAVGIFTSALTRSQLIAGVSCFAILFLIVAGGRFLGELPWNEHWRPLFEYLYPFDHLDDFSRGIWDSRALFLYPSVAIILLEMTTLVVKAKK